MAASGLMVTVVGWAASTPREVVGDGVAFTSFRVATTPRWFDSRAGTWADGRTEWITVKAFREVAFNVAASIRKGDPVLVHGRLRTEEWVGDNGPRHGLVLDAAALGHDLTHGRSSFARRVHVAAGDGSGDGADGGSAAAGAGGSAAEAGSDAWEVDPWASDVPVPDDVPVGREAADDGTPGGADGREPTAASGVG